MRVSVEYRTGSKQTYDRFCAAHPDITISFKEWAKVIHVFNENYRDYLLQSGDKAKMPFGFGPFAVSKKKIKITKIFKGKEYINLKIDWQKTKKAGKHIYHLNTHSDGYQFQWYWFSFEARFALADVWNFKPSRLTSRLINTYVRKPNSNYAQIYKIWKRK